MSKDNLSSKISSEIACCSDLLETLFSLGPTEVIIFYSLDEGRWKTVADLSFLTGKESSTVYRSLQKLVNSGLAVRDVRTLKEGGYYFVYSLLSIDKLSDLIMKKIESLSQGMKKLLSDLLSELNSRKEYISSN
ncbi:MAG: ArsR family transcriptional regulator [Candidatus Thermoplasmatota archaeon]|jgi:predicted transcriptional regulator|nr:ArsR family transcriptional regulator [Candidatus Thermoplasmatota archaeon]